MKYTILALALSLGVAQADIPAGITNQTHNGANIQGGTYFNTNGSETKFTNTAGTGITLLSGQNIRGVEVQNGAYTGNGGNIHIQAPDQVVKLEGNIDVRGFQPTGGIDVPYGNGGKVTIDAAYLFQNGNIYATGNKGGTVQMNVGGMTMGPYSRIEAGNNAYFTTDTGTGGRVSIQSTGTVNIPSGAFIGTTGGYTEVTGKVVNMDGILQADGGYDRGGGKITLVATDGDLNIGMTPNTRYAAILQANSGTINLSASHDINQNGAILNGGDSTNYHADTDQFDYTPGGKVNLMAGNNINNTNRIQADGANFRNGTTSPAYGNDGGTIVVSARNINNTGIIRANGGTAINSPSGNGGSITFLGANPMGEGTVTVFGGDVGGNGPHGALGTITAPDPVQSTNTLMGVWKKSQ